MPQCFQSICFIDGRLRCTVRFATKHWSSTVWWEILSNVILLFHPKSPFSHGTSSQTPYFCTSPIVSSDNLPQITTISPSNNWFLRTFTSHTVQGIGGACSQRCTLGQLRVLIDIETLQTHGGHHPSAKPRLLATLTFSQSSTCCSYIETWDLQKKTGRFDTPTDLQGVWNVSPTNFAAWKQPTWVYWIGNHTMWSQFHPPCFALLLRKNHWSSHGEVLPPKQKFQMNPRTRGS